MSTFSSQRKFICVIGGGIAVTLLWFLYNKSRNQHIQQVQKSTKSKKKSNSDRYSHFLAIKIDNPFIVALGKEIQVKKKMKMNLF